MKTKELSFFLIATILLPSLILTSCFNDVDCISTSEPFVKFDFKDIDSYEADTMEIDSIKVTDISDSLFYRNTELSSFELPISEADTFTVTIYPEVGIEKSITLTYQLTPKLLSEECGIVLIYDHLSQISTQFDSVSVINGLLDEETTTNVEIFD